MIDKTKAYCLWLDRLVAATLVSSMLVLVLAILVRRLW
jgi:hypothetical protein